MNKKIQRIKKRNLNRNPIGHPPNGETIAVKKKWKQIVKIIPNTLACSDRASLLNLVRCLVALDEMEDHIRENGRFVIAQSGIYKDSPVVSPIETHRIKAEQQCLSLLKEFNLTPKTYLGLKKKPNDANSNVFGA